MSKHTVECLRRVCFAVIAACSIIGCRTEPDARTRYELEKAIWKAEQFRRRAVSNPFSESREDFRAAVAALQNILAAERFNRPGGDDRNTMIATDLRRLILKCKIALAELCFVEFEDYAGVTYPAWIEGPHDLILTNHFGPRLTKVRSIYDSSGGDSLETRCAEAFRGVAGDPLLWLGKGSFGDTLLALPAWLARIQSDRGEVRLFDYSRAAEDFYSEIVRTWPDSVIADKARLRRAEFYVLGKRFVEAIGDLDGVLEGPYPRDKRGDLLLRKGEVLAHGLRREDEAVRVLKAVIAEYPRSPASQGAILSLAELKARHGRSEDAARMLRDLELDRATPGETAAARMFCNAAAAMFLRALLFERNGDWPAAVQLLWRICRMEPFTHPAAVAPLVIVERYIKNGESAVVQSVLEQADKFYLDAIGKDSAYIGQPHVLKDFLIESYLLADKPAVVADRLAALAVEWRADNGCVGLYKSALIYLRLLHDEKIGVPLLQKCLDLYPTARYAWIVRAELDRMSPNSDKPH